MMRFDKTALDVMADEDNSTIGDERTLEEMFNKVSRGCCVYR